LRRRQVLVTVIAVVVGLAAMAWQIRRAPEIYPSGDAATTSIYTLRAIKGELATGAYSRFTWNHPGPLLYEMLAPLYALSGRREVSLKWTILGFNLALLGALLVYARRRSPWLCIALALALLPLVVFEQRLLFWSWNPVAPLMPLALALTLAAGVCAGDVAVLPWVIALVSLMVQSHVALAPVSLLLLAAVLASVAWSLRTADAGRRRQMVRAAAAGLMTAVALWAVPVLHDLRAPSGNLAAVARFAAEAHSRRSWMQSADIVANELVATFNPARELITGELPASAGPAVRAIAASELSVLGIAVVVLYRRRHLFEAAFAALSFAASVVAVVAVRAIVGDMLDYLVLWIGVVGILNVASIVSTLALLTRGPVFQTRKWDIGLRGATIAWLGIVAALGISRLEWKQRADAGDQTLFYLAADLRRYCDEHHYTRPLLSFDWRAWTVASGLILQRYKVDRMTAVNDDAIFMFGEPFRRSGAEDAELYLMPADDDAVPTGVVRYTWITTVNGYRLIHVFRNPPAR
jgi:hypothetical protein